LGQANNTEELNRVESELKKLREDKIRGIIMRTKAKWNVEGREAVNISVTWKRDILLKKLFLS
jgi:hypothetical protein